MIEHIVPGNEHNNFPHGANKSWETNKLYKSIFANWNTVCWYNTQTVWLVADDFILVTHHSQNCNFKFAVHSIYIYTENIHAKKYAH